MIVLKKTRKIFSALLVVCLLICGIPYSTAMGLDSDEGFHNGDVSYVRTKDDLGWLNINLDYIEYQFVQSKDNQKFKFTQTVNFQKTSGLRYAAGQYFKLYTGDLSEVSGPKTGQYPASVTENPTNEFINTYGASFDYTATKKYSQEEENFPNGAFGFKGSIVDVGGCPNYGWDMDVTFNGQGTERGGFETGFCRELYWIYADIESNNESSKTHRYLRILTKVSVTDIRDILDLVDDVNAKLRDSSISDKLKENLRAVLGTIPADLLDGTKYYPQSVVDGYYENLASVADNIADYSEYDTAYRRAHYLACDSVNTDHYTKESLEAFTARIDEINSGLNRNLGDTDTGNAIVAKAAQDINDAYKLLVNQDSASSGSYELYGTTKVVVVGISYYTMNPSDNFGNTGYGNSFLYAFLNNTEHNFMQLTDGERMSFSQTLTAFRNIKMRDDVLKLRDFDFDYTNPDENCTKENHSGFVPAISSNTTKLFTDRLDGSVYNGSKLTSWVYNKNFDTTELYEKYPSPDQYQKDKFTVGPNNLVCDDGTILTNKDQADGKIGISNGSYSVYSADSNLIFYGNDYSGSNNTSTSKGNYSLNFQQALTWSYRDSILAEYTDRHVHIGSTVNVTDCRDFLNDYYDARYFYDSLGGTNGGYTNSSVSNLWNTVLDTSETATGTVYKTQAVVDAEEKALEEALAGVELLGDYSGYNEAYAQALSLINAGNEDEEITPAAFSEFIDTVEKLNDELNRDLGVSNQAVIDKASEDMYSAIEKMQKSLSNLEYIELLLKDDSDLKIDRTQTVAPVDVIILNENEAVVDDLTKQFKNNSLCLKFFTCENNEIVDKTKKVGTAGTIRLYNKDTEELLDTVYVIMLGDVNGDALVNDDDMDIAVDAGLSGDNYPNRLFFIANDMCSDGVLDVIDVCSLSLLKNK